MMASGTSKLILVLLLGALICTSTSARKLLNQKGALGEQKTFFNFPGYGGGLGGGGGGGIGGGGGLGGGFGAGAGEIGRAHV